MEQSICWQCQCCNWYNHCWQCHRWVFLGQWCAVVGHQHKLQQCQCSRLFAHLHWRYQQFNWQRHHHCQCAGCIHLGQRILFIQRRWRQRLWQRQCSSISNHIHRQFVSRQYISRQYHSQWQFDRSRQHLGHGQSHLYQCTGFGHRRSFDSVGCQQPRGHRRSGYRSRLFQRIKSTYWFCQRLHRQNLESI